MPIHKEWNRGWHKFIKMILLLLAFKNLFYSNMLLKIGGTPLTIQELKQRMVSHLHRDEVCDKGNHEKILTFHALPKFGELGEFYLKGIININAKHAIVYQLLIILHYKEQVQSIIIRNGLCSYHRRHLYFSDDDEDNIITKERCYIIIFFKNVTTSISWYSM